MDEIGVNWKVATPYAYIGKKHWNLKEGGLSQNNIERLMRISTDYAETMQRVKKKEHSELEEYKIRNQSTREILELTLEKFVWSKAANDGTIGPALLFSLAGEVKDFLAMGGKVGRQRLQMQLDIARNITLNTTWYFRNTATIPTG